MPTHSFSVLIAAEAGLSDEQFSALTEILAKNGCDDATVAGHPEGIEVMFDREATDLMAAMKSAVINVAKAKQKILRLQIAAEAFAPAEQPVTH